MYIHMCRYKYVQVRVHYVLECVEAGGEADVGHLPRSPSILFYEAGVNQTSNRLLWLRLLACLLLGRGVHLHLQRLELQGYHTHSASVCGFSGWDLWSRCLYRSDLTTEPSPQANMVNVILHTHTYLSIRDGAFVLF